VETSRSDTGWLNRRFVLVAAGCGLLIFVGGFIGIGRKSRPGARVRTARATVPVSIATASRQDVRSI